MSWDNVENHFATNVYYDHAFKCQAAKLLPGEYYYTQQDMLIVTVLGSCVSACIRDPQVKMGGMNHFMLPDAGHDLKANHTTSMRYGIHAMDILIKDLLAAGARMDRLEAKVFGGGNVTKGFNHMNVGECNAAFVLDYLRRRNIRILAEDLNDVYPRKVYFFPHTGKVLVRKIRELRNDTLIKREIDYARRLHPGE